MALGREQAERLLRLLELVRGAPFNLTAIRDPAEMRRKHLLDSLTLLPVARLAAGERVFDVGSGAGFPGLVLAVVCPEVRVELIEANARKGGFLQSAADALHLPNVGVRIARAEDLGREAGWRASADCVVARAVAPLPVLLEYVLPLCRVGGRCVALKGPRAPEEVAAAANALNVLGGVSPAPVLLRLPGGGEQRVLVRIDKVRPTPARYPRAAGQPARRPL